MYTRLCQGCSSDVLLALPSTAHHAGEPSITGDSLLNNRDPMHDQHLSQPWRDSSRPRAAEYQAVWKMFCTMARGALSATAPSSSTSARLSDQLRHSMLSLTFLSELAPGMGRLSCAMHQLRATCAHAKPRSLLQGGLLQRLSCHPIAGMHACMHVCGCRWSLAVTSTRQKASDGMHTSLCMREPSRAWLWMMKGVRQAWLT